MSMPPTALESTQFPALSQERIIQLFKQKNWRYYIDNEGDLGGMWEDNTFHFMLRGEKKEILVVSGRWHNNCPFEKLEQIRELIINWHRGKLWPKCYHRIDDEGRIRLYTEVSVDYEHGLTDKQLEQHIDCALGTSGQFFSMLDEELVS
ncbi:MULTISPECIES: YbjN domain-containing protein [unclassified Schaalia]|uniref:YbjN domain-containing protein n=1 Tax=unclassified Schaalia TaxID=2691889 RepID=UPI001E5BF71A|nr:MULTISPECIES: YbjN domain-containing protein [unclassified Schaalia]MCD4549491.1 YbjN domain-containing protein [Schaalia sp. lx-260]MCD4558052.1 YbjN domain-containing protein [Schaalia sp. lx-100]